MSISKVSDFAVGDIDLTAKMSTLNHAYKGQAQVTLSNYDNDSAPVVKVGSVFDNNGTQYAVTGSDETPTGYSGISNSTTFYLYFDESAEAFIYSSTSPSWSDDLQGWYNGNDRALFSMYKDSGGTLYKHKNIITNNNIRMKRYSLGVWDMDTTNYIIYTLEELGIDSVDNILNVNGIIYNDSDTIAGYALSLQYDTGGGAAGYFNINTSSTPHRLFIGRNVGGTFDSGNYNRTDMNRGYITVMYNGDKP